MKPSNISFLFFLFLIFFTSNSYCQINDSISYYSALIQNPKNSDDLAISYRFFLKKKDEYSNKALIRDEIFATQNIADIQKQLGYIDESERLNIECLELLDLIEDDEWSIRSKVKTINDLGKIYRYKKDYKEALKIYKTGLNLAKKKSDENIILNNIGFVYLQKNELQSALKYFDSAYKNALENNDTLNIARSLDNLGFTKSKMGRDDAEEDLIQALNIRKNVNYNNGITNSYENLAKHFQSINDSEKALFYSDKVIYLAKKSNSLEQLESALRLKIELGYDFVKSEYINIRDSIDDIKDTDRNNFNYYVYQYGKKEKQLQDSRLENAKQKSENLVYLLFGIVVFFGSIFLYFYLKSKHKKEKLKEIYNTESRISKKVHDEVANDVFQLMTKLEHEDQIDSEVINELNSLYARTRDISKEHGTLNSDYPFVDYLGELIESFQDTETNIIIKGLTDISWNLLPEIHRVTIYKVLQELLINMKKHSQASIVVLVFEKEKRKLNISVNDNGVGASTLKRSNGLQNTENRIQSINGTIIFETEPNKGFKTKITI
ncbi:tetratricopeptide repeat-containing sensor histidine kinase [Psychroserpens jangbogonensis]|uniref:tetratricopeptide repeat-containing sensor histidine kinase n=1 Tax=Psychroserpens jangbogonensis TaxID=1484460 RepID=UPI00053E5D1E|nr:tetratricopeptide repeat-containing sensor histidine kinase [Psychroserpens jangbogonensis]